ncbi:insulinase family protein, partial [Lactococcus lactis]
MTEIKMADGVMLHLIKESKFKTVRLMVRFREEMSADTLGKRVLISNMLESTNAVYQTGKDFSRKLSEMLFPFFSHSCRKRSAIHFR